MDVVTAYIALGSNICPFENIPKTLEFLERSCDVTAVSMFYRSPALERPEQDEYLNGACAVTTGRTARALKYQVLRMIEASIGRERSEDPYAPRPIDLDIVLYGAQVIDEPGLMIPDPDIRQRPFLAVPLLEIAPALRLPDTDEPLADLVAAMDTSALTPETDFSQHMKARYAV